MSAVTPHTQFRAKQSQQRRVMESNLSRAIGQEPRSQPSRSGSLTLLSLLGELPQKPTAKGVRHKLKYRPVSPLRLDVAIDRSDMPYRETPGRTPMIDAATQTDESSLSSMSSLSLAESSRTPSPVAGCGGFTFDGEAAAVAPQFDDQDLLSPELVRRPRVSSPPPEPFVPAVTPLPTASDISPEAPVMVRHPQPTKAQMAQWRKQNNAAWSAKPVTPAATPASKSVGDLPKEYLTRPPTPPEPWVVSNQFMVQRELNGGEQLNSEDESTDTDAGSEVDEKGNLRDFVKESLSEVPLGLPVSPEESFRMAEHHREAVADADMQPEGDYGDSGDEAEENEAAEECAYRNQESRYIDGAAQEDSGDEAEDEDEDEDPCA